MGWEAWLIIFVGVSLFMGALSFVVASWFVFRATMVREKPEKWQHGCGEPDIPYMVSMYDTGMEWYSVNKQFARPVEVRNAGLRLCGEFFDYGFQRCVVIVPGRCDCLDYSYFYAAPYRALGLNVLVIDQRAHGESEGKYITMGYEESVDLAAWLTYAREKLGQKWIAIHGICIGSVCALFAYRRNVGLFDALIADGMYKDFYYVFRRHVVERHKPPFPTMIFTDMWELLFTGHSMHSGATKVLRTFTKPLLMLHSREDSYAYFDEAEVLFAACPSENKRLEPFPHGRHSQLRYIDSEKYDAAIDEFINGVIK